MFARALRQCCQQQRQMLVQGRTLQHALRRISGKINAPGDMMDKYREKLDEKARRGGFGSVQDMISHYEKVKEKQIMEKVEKWKQEEAKLSKEGKGVEGGKGDEVKTGQPGNQFKGLNKFVKVELLENETPERIGEIWNQYHMEKTGSISGVMTLDFYRQLRERTAEYPVFVLPIPRDSGYEVFFMQAINNSILFTPLLEYKAKQEHARPYLVITHYDELADAKGIVLMHGEILGKALNAEDAKLLVYMSQRFYVTGSSKKKQLVETFHKNPAAFNFQTRRTD
ncbi:hypothetical protein HDU96_004000 [Phlyctochytrium bullatum]|nr:hypothetical protein HDU96_004000 [Phlyctochytrium bullatum]